MKPIEILFALLRFELNGEELSESIKSGVSEETLEALYKCSKAHDIAHIICSALEKNDLLPADGDIASKFRNEQLLSVYRYQRLNAEAGRINRVLSEAGIEFIPLKGSVIRAYYPEPWMRTSCDIDILVHEEELDRAVDAVVLKLGYDTDRKRDYHDISLRSSNGVHLELHFSILENLENVDRLLSRAWEYALPRSEGALEYKLTDEFLMFYAIAHMSYHFIFGGCGIRPFIDLWLMKKHNGYDEEKLNALCCECGIEKFYNSVSELAEIWFSDAEYNDLSREIEKYIILGGVYGDYKSTIAVRNAKSGGAFKHILTRIFQPYNILREKYPILKKHRFLTPFYEVKRWFDLLFKGKGRSFVNLVKVNNTVTDEHSEELKLFLEKLGL